MLFKFQYNEIVFKEVCNTLISSKTHLLPYSLILFPLLGHYNC